MEKLPQWEDTKRHNCVCNAGSLIRNRTPLENWWNSSKTYRAVNSAVSVTALKSRNTGRSICRVSRNCPYYSYKFPKFKIIPELKF